MILESGKIYKRKYFRDSYLCPTLEVIGSATIYVSNKSEQPASTSEMSELTNIQANSLNVITGMTRWIAAEYSDSDESNVVYEMGLVESPYKSN